MDNNYLHELILAAQAQGGGVVLNLDSVPAAVVLTVDKYNQLVNSSAIALAKDGGLTGQPDLFTDEILAAKMEPAMPVKKEKVLVTGGAGYIGAHAARRLLATGYEVVVLDNLSSGKRRNVPENARFVEGDLADTALLRDLFLREKFDSVMHFAASIEVEESVKEPQKYFDNNVLNTARLLGAMAEAGVKHIIFSSTAAVYGDQTLMPINESAKVSPVNPYGYSKLLAERIIKYYCQYLGLRAVVFRYFNACGCDFDGAIEPTHQSHLLSVVMKVATGKQDQLTVFGEDYPTFDGTCVRDYVHVLDIARAHAAALEKIGAGENYRVYNIGTGKGCSVLEMINQTAELLNRIIPMQIGPRRAGDPAELVADNSKLLRELGSELKYSDLPTIITTAFKQAENFKN